MFEHLSFTSFCRRGLDRVPSQAAIALLLFTLLSFATIGIALIVIAWLAAGLGSIALVGQLFFLASAASLLMSFFAGPLADSDNRIWALRSGQAIRLLAALLFCAGSMQQDWLFASLVLHSLLVAMGTSLSAGAIDGIFQNAIPPANRMRIAIGISIAQQLGLVLGTGLGGLLLHHYPTIVSALLMVVLVLLQMVIVEMVIRFHGRGTMPATAARPGELLTFWQQGLRSSFADLNLFAAVIGISLLFSVAQMTNVLLPGFVNNQLARGSDVYGLLETAWAVGGAASLLAAAMMGSRLSGMRRLEFFMLCCIGGVMISFALSRSLVLLLILSALLGALFSMARAICNGRILLLARNDEIGRVRSASIMLTSLIGMVIYVSPSVIGHDNTVIYYCVWGVVIALAGLGLMAVLRK